MIVSVNHNEYADIQKFIAQPWKPSLEIFATWFLHTGIPFEMKETGPNLSVMCVTIVASAAANSRITLGKGDKKKKSKKEKQEEVVSSKKSTVKWITNR